MKTKRLFTVTINGVKFEREVKTAEDVIKVLNEADAYVDEQRSEYDIEDFDLKMEYYGDHFQLRPEWNSVVEAFNDEIYELLVGYVKYVAEDREVLDILAMTGYSDGGDRELNENNIGTAFDDDTELLAEYMLKYMAL